MKSITIYSDGACSGNPGPGGWGAILIYKDHTKEIYGSERNTTNNRMELLSAIKALEIIDEKCSIELYTDSMYVKEGITNWICKWKINNWTNSQKKPVKNSDLWKILSDLCVKHEISWHWVKGHSNNYHNIKADQLAVKGRDQAKLMI